MAAGSAGSLENVELGFAPTNTSVVTLAATSVGYLDGDAVLSVPREVAFVRSALTPIKHVVTAKDVRLSFSAREILLENLQYAFDNDAAASGVLTIDEDVGATVALVLTTYAPNASSAGTTADEDTRSISIPKALSVGDGAYTIPRATSGETNQSMAFEFMALGNTGSNGLLATITDDYT